MTARIFLKVRAADLSAQGLTSRAFPKFESHGTVRMPAFCGHKSQDCNGQESWNRSSRYSMRRGLELHQYLTGRGIGIPTIIITAHDDGAARQRCELAGTAAYLLKPIKDTVLLKAIARARRRGE